MKNPFAARSAKLISLATKLGARELGQVVREQFVKGVDEIASGRLKTRIDQARLIADQLAQLKGAAMKVGQLLSIDATDLLPPEALDILSRLQGGADPVDWAIIEKVLISELGPEKVAQFENLSHQATASASIGQVHRARLNGQDVAIKVQYPDVKESIDSDLKLLRTVVEALLGLSGRKIELSELFDELALVLHQEADYVNEMKNMREYRDHLASQPMFTVPEPIASHSSERVLTMTWQNGISLNEWLKKKPSAADRSQIGAWLLDLYFQEFYDWGLVQTDPNYGNFLIQENPLRLVVLDFGATLRYTPEFRRSYVGLLQFVDRGNESETIEGFIRAGLIDRRESNESRRLLLEMMNLGVEPFHPSRQPFDFANADYARRTREVTQAFTQSLKYSPPPRQLIFLHRKLGGVFSFLKKLEAKIDVAPYWEKNLKSPRLAVKEEKRHATFVLICRCCDEFGGENPTISLLHVQLHANPQNQYTSFSLLNDADDVFADLNHQTAFTFASEDQMKNLILTFAAITVASQAGFAANVFVRNARGSNLSERQVAQVTDLVKRSVRRMPEHSIVSSESRAEYILQPSIVQRGDAMSLRVDKLKGTETIASAEQPITSVNASGFRAMQVTETAMVDGDESDTVADTSMDRTSGHDGLSGNDRSVSGMTSNSNISDENDTDQNAAAPMTAPVATEQGANNANVNQNMANTDADTGRLNDRTPVPPAQVGADVRAASPRFQSTERKGFFDVGIGPAFGLGMKSDQAMYDLNLGYTRNMGPQLAAKLFADLNLGTGSEATRFLNFGVGGEFYPAGKVTSFGAPYAAADLGFAFARTSENRTVDAPAVGAGAGFKFAANEVNYDVSANYTILTARVEGSTPSVLGVRLALNF